MIQGRDTTFGRAEFELKQELNAMAFSQYYILNCALSEIMENDGFNYIGSHVNHGMCYEAATAVMIALRGFPETCLVQAKAYSVSRGYVGHAWVELRYHGHHLVIDPCWLESKVPSSQSPVGNAYFAPRQEFYTITEPRNAVFIMHDDFWRYSLSGYLSAIFRQPHADVEQAVLLSCYRPPNQAGIGFNSWVDLVADNAALRQQAITEFIRCNVWPNNLYGIMLDFIKHRAG